MALEEEGVDRGEALHLPTDGASLKVVVGTADSRASRPTEKKVFSLDDAQALKRKRGFSHDDMAEVERERERERERVVF